MKRLIFVFAVLLVLVGCKSVPKTEGSLLNGMIYDEDNEPVANVSISVNGEVIATSDVDGHFVLEKQFDAGSSVKFICSKSGFEEVEFSCELLAVPQLVYIKMSSFYQLLSQAENDILENRLEEAQKKLDRAEVVKPGQITTQYLRAICFYKKGEQETAREILDAMDFENEYVKKFLKAIDKKNEKEKE